MLVNGKHCNLLSIRDRGLLYGDGVFRTLRAVKGRALHWSLHYRKLHDDCTSLGITCPEEAVLASELGELLVQHPDGVIKLIVTRGEGARGYAPPVRARPVHIWDVSTLPDYPDEWYSDGIKLHVCQLRLSYQPQLAGIKHLNRLENVLAAAEWSGADIAEGLLLDGAGHVIEGTRSNLFMVRDGALQTPDLSLCGVAGVQRERVLKWAIKHNIPCRVAQFGLEELLTADEVFLVNSVMGLWPVCEVQGRTWQQFPVARQIGAWLNATSD